MSHFAPHREEAKAKMREAWARRKKMEEAGRVITSIETLGEALSPEVIAALALISKLGKQSQGTEPIRTREEAAAARKGEG